MTRRLRIVDSGTRPATWHLAASAALAERHRAGLTPDTLRFQTFPPCALIGRHQILDREIDRAWCAAHGVALGRRVTGGGAIVMAPGILGWELLLPTALFPGGLGEAVSRICTAAAAGISRLGVAARFRPRNDIEVEGRKLGGTGGYFDGPTLLYQGTVLASLDRELIRRALRWPSEKLGRHGVTATDERVTDLATLLGRAPPLPQIAAALADGLADGLGFTREDGRLDADEEAAASQLEAEEIGTAAFIQGAALPAGGAVLSHAVRTPGGMIEAHAKLRPGADGIIESLLITGDGFVNPPRTFADLEAALKDTPLAESGERARLHLQASGASFLGCGPGDIAACLAGLADQHPAERGN